MKELECFFGGQRVERERGSQAEEGGCFFSEAAAHALGGRGGEVAVRAGREN